MDSLAECEDKWDHLGNRGVRFFFVIDCYCFKKYIKGNISHDTGAFLLDTMSEVLLFFIFPLFVSIQSQLQNPTGFFFRLWNKSINYRAGTQGINFPCHRISWGAAARTRIACCVESHISWYISSVPKIPIEKELCFNPCSWTLYRFTLISNNFYYYSFFAGTGTGNVISGVLSVGTREMPHHWHNYDDDW